MRTFTNERTLLEKKFSVLTFWFRIFGIALAAVSGVLCYSSVYFGKGWSWFSQVFFGTAIIGLTLFASAFVMWKVIRRYGDAEGSVLFDE